MTDTPDTPKPVAALVAEIQAAVGAIPRSGGDKEKGRTIGDIYERVGPEMAARGVTLASDVTYAKVRVVTATDRNGKPRLLEHAMYAADYVWCGPAGDTHRACGGAGSSADSLDGGHAMAHAMSLAYRDAVLQSLCAPYGERHTAAAHAHRSQGASGAAASHNGAPDAAAAAQDATGACACPGLTDGQRALHGRYPDRCAK